MKTEEQINAEKRSKPRPDLIPGRALLAMGEVMAYGYNKHGDCTWKREGTEQANPRTHIASAARHLAEYLDDAQATEEGSGLPVLWHAASQLAISIDCERQAERPRLLGDTRDCNFDEALAAWGKRQSQPRPVIYLDMDGVVADFVRGAFTALGCDPDVGYQNVTSWDGIAPEVARQNGEAWSDDEFWAELQVLGHSFWANLKIAPFAQEIVKTCEGAGLDVVFMSTPSRDPASASGKIAWLQEHFPDLARSFSLTPCKAAHARPGAILIDDSDRNVEEFRAAGGEAFLWPQPWNEMRGNEGRPALEMLKKTLANWSSKHR